MEVESSRPPIIQLFYILYTIIVKLLRTLCTDEFIAISEVVLCFDVCEGATGTTGTQLIIFFQIVAFAPSKFHSFMFNSVS